MTIRPVDASGDVLPVLASSDMLSGTEALALLVEDRLKLLTGDWWENPAWGCEILDLLKESRLTEADQQAMASYLTSYIRETGGVREVRDASFSLNGRQMAFSCTVVSEDGEARTEISI